MGFIRKIKLLFTCRNYNTKLLVLYYFLTGLQMCKFCQKNEVMLMGQWLDQVVHVLANLCFVTYGVFC